MIKMKGLDGASQWMHVCGKNWFQLEILGSMYRDVQRHL